MMCYEGKTECLERCEKIASHLLYGDLTEISKPWLSVVVPTFKRAQLLEESLQSLLTQHHVDFFWDIVVVDNEPFDDKVNDTERLIKKIDNKRILYYRNEKQLLPGDNFNKAVILARGKWVTFLHDDDLLIASSLKKISDLIGFCSKKSKPLGAIAASYYQFEYDEVNKIVKADIPNLNIYLSSQPTCFDLYKITHNNLLVTSHIGGSVPSNGTTYLKEAFITAGGINEDFGISGDLIHFYNIGTKYAVYQTRTPLGFYRWGGNSMVKSESTYRVIKDGLDFREYIYSRSFLNKLIGVVLKNCHWEKFTTDVISERNKIGQSSFTLKDFEGIYDNRPTRLMYFVYTRIVLRAYNLYKRCQSKWLARGIG